jgi:hypothetical protein
MYPPKVTADELEPMDRLVAGIMRRAVADARQAADPALAQEAWLFLEVCAPTVAEKLRRQINEVVASEFAQSASEEIR